MLQTNKVVVTLTAFETHFASYKFSSFLTSLPDNHTHLMQWLALCLEVFLHTLCVTNRCNNMNAWNCATLSLFVQFIVSRPQIYTKHRVLGERSEKHGDAARRLWWQAFYTTSKWGHSEQLVRWHIVQSSLFEVRLQSSHATKLIVIT